MVRWLLAIILILSASDSFAAGWNGSGTFTRARDWTTDELNDEKPAASRFDEEDDNFAAGINACLTKDGQNAPSANLPMGGFRHTNVGNASARSQYATAAQVQDSLLCSGTSTGTANALVLTLSPAITSYVTGQVFHVKANATNTASTTLNVNDVGEVEIKKNGGASLSPGDIVSGQIYSFFYNGPESAFAPLSPLNSVSASTVSATSMYAATINADTISATTIIGGAPVGSLMPFAGTSSTVPSGWVIAAGQSVSRTGVYANLFAVIGTTYGSADGNSFNIPDLRGRSVFGLDNMGGSAANRVTSGVSGITGTTLGAVGGDQRMQAHTHTANVSETAHSHAMQGGAGGTNGATSGQGNAGSSPSGSVRTESTLTNITVSNTTAGAGSSENMPPAIMLNMIIKI